MHNHMPDPSRTTGSQPGNDERQRGRSPDDRDQRLEHDATNSKPDRGHDEATQGRPSQDTDPDSPDADIDRDDMIDEP